METEGPIPSRGPWRGVRGGRNSRERKTLEERGKQAGGEKRPRGEKRRRTGRLEGDRTNVPAAHASNPEVAWEMESLLAQRRAAIKRPGRVRPLHRRRRPLQNQVRAVLGGERTWERNAYKKRLIYLPCSVIKTLCSWIKCREPTDLARYFAKHFEIIVYRIYLSNQRRRLCASIFADIDTNISTIESPMPRRQQLTGCPENWEKNKKILKR